MYIGCVLVMREKHFTPFPETGTKNNLRDPLWKIRDEFLEKRRILAHY